MPYQIYKKRKHELWQEAKPVHARWAFHEDQEDAHCQVALINQAKITSNIYRAFPIDSHTKKPKIPTDG